MKELYLCLTFFLNRFTKKMGAKYSLLLLHEFKINLQMFETVPMFREPPVKEYNPELNILHKIIKDILQK